MHGENKLDFYVIVMMFWPDKIYYISKSEILELFKLDCIYNPIVL
jgi:hypothetical protein